MSLSFNNPYVFMITLGVLIITAGFKVPGDLEKQYLKKYTAFVEELSKNDTEYNKVIKTPKFTEESSRLIEGLIYERSNIEKKKPEVDELKGEINLRIFLSQIIILAGTFLVTLGSSLWFFEWKQNKNSKIIVHKT